MENAETFSNVKAITCPQLHKVLVEYGSLLSWGPEEVVLDAGCGPGDMTADVLLPWLPPDCQAVLGVDISPSMVRHALSKHVGGKLDFAVAEIGGDVSHIAGLNEKYANGFDKIFSFFMLHWIQNLELGIRNLKELLKPKGQILLYFPVDRIFPLTFQKARAMDNWKEYFKGVTRKIPSLVVLENDPIGEFEKLVKTAGLQIETCKLVNDTTIYPTITKLKELIESIDPDCSCVPQHLRDQYLNDCVRVLEKDGAVEMEEDGRAVLTQTCLLAFLKH